MSMRDRITERLKALGLTLRGASTQAGLNSHFLTHYFRKAEEDPNTGMNSDSLLKLAKVLETSPEWLLEGRNPASDASSAEIVDIWDAIEDRDDRDEVLEFARWKASRENGSRDRR